jgi:uncharacterized membrane protein
MAFHPFWFGPFLFAVFVALAAFVMLILLLINYLNGPGRMGPFPVQGPPPQPPPREAPLDILARRFASGEMSADEYERAKNLLRDEPGPAS